MKSISKSIEQMKLAFANAQLPEIAPHLEPVGYTAAKLTELTGKVAELEELMQKQKQEYAEQYAATDAFEKQRAEIDAEYKKHFGLARVFFREDVQARATLELGAYRQQAYGAWYTRLNNFYKQVLSTPDYLAKFTACGIAKEDLENVQSQLVATSDTKEAQKKETGEAQKATETRDQLFDQLYAEYRELLDYARALLPDEQMLEAMGIVVRR